MRHQQSTRLLRAALLSLGQLPDAGALRQLAVGLLGTPAAAPCAASSSGLIRSIGSGKTIVEFCSPPISDSVCR